MEEDSHKILVKGLDILGTVEDRGEDHRPDRDDQISLSSIENSGHLHKTEWSDVR